MPQDDLSDMREAGSFSIWHLATPSLAASVTLLAVAVCAAVVVFQMQRDASSLLQEVAEAGTASDGLKQSVEQLQECLKRYAQTGDPSTIRQVPDLQQQSQQYLVEIGKTRLGRRGEVVTTLQRFYVDLEDQLETDSPDATSAAAQAAEFLEMQDELMNQVLQDAQQESRALTRWTGWTLLLLGIVGSGAGTLAGFSLARSMQRQLVQLSVPIRSAAGSLDGVVGPLQVSGSGRMDDLEDSLHDLADRVASVVERLQAAERETLRNDQMAALGQLAAGLAHELRNPLTAMKTLVEAARDPETGTSLDDRDLAVLEEEIGRLDVTLQGFLDYARPPALCKSDLELRDLVDKTVQLVKARADRESIRLEVVLPDQPVQITADPGQLRQVLLNLLLNAFDAVPEGGTVVLQVESPDSDQVVFHVRDNGPGISESVRDHLFEPFVSSKPSGTGLGLTICRRIVENHGGRIAAANQPDGGTEMTVSLPRSTGGSKSQNMVSSPSPGEA